MTIDDDKPIQKEVYGWIQTIMGKDLTIGKLSQETKEIPEISIHHYDAYSLSHSWNKTSVLPLPIPSKLAS